MSKLETNRPHYQTIQAWGTEFNKLNNPDLVSEMLTRATMDESRSLLLNHFTPHGVTAVVLSPTGILSAHHWPEENFGFYTGFSRDPNMIARFKRELVSQFQPEEIGPTRPPVKHLLARFTVSDIDMLEFPELLLDNCQKIAFEGHLKAFPQLPTHLRVAKKAVGVVGLETSHLSFDLKQLEVGRFEATVDVLSCDESVVLDRIERSIRETTNPINQPMFIQTEYGPEVYPIPCTLSRERLGHSELLVRNIELPKAYHSSSYL
jgi:hypothetical protein